jgi:hypothetical protein
LPSEALWVNTLTAMMNTAESKRKRRSDDHDQDPGNDSKEKSSFLSHVERKAC